MKHLSNISKDVLHIILEYDGRIKYRNGKYINIIDKNNEIYNIINPLITKKKEIIKTIHIHGRDFYFEFGFDICHDIGLCYDYGFNAADIFEICYYDMRNDGLKQIKTYL